MILLPEPDSKCSVVCGPGLLIIIDLITVGLNNHHDA